MHGRPSTVHPAERFTPCPIRHLAVRQDHRLGRREWLQDVANLLPFRDGVGEIDLLDRPGLIAVRVGPGNHEPLVRDRVAAGVQLNQACGRAAVGPELERLVHERPVVLRGNVPVRILQRCQDIQAPGIPVGEARRAAPDAEPGAALLTLALRVPICRSPRNVFALNRAVVDLAVERTDLPIVLSQVPSGRPPSVDREERPSGHSRARCSDRSSGRRLPEPRCSRGSP